MPIPGPGTQVTFDQIQTEFGGTNPIGLNEYYRGGGLVPTNAINNAVPTSGQISLSNFYGSSSRTPINLTISSSTSSYDVYTNRTPAYVPGSSDIVVTINPGVTLTTPSVASYSLSVPSSFSPTDTVRIVNNGIIVGRGGNGGTGGGLSLPGTSYVPGNSGGAAGSAVYVNRPTTITNNGTIAGGGGGGGGGGAYAQAAPGPSFFVGTGGGGGGGVQGGTGAAGGTYAGAGWFDYTGGAGSPSPGTTGGSGGGGKGAGGAGGGYGANGSNGNPGPNSTFIGQNAGRPGGTGGKYIVGNGFVTWPATGTRYGGVG